MVDFARLLIMEANVVKCKLNTDQKVLNVIKKQLDNKELTIEDLLILENIKKFLAAKGWEIFKTEKAHRVQYDEATKTGSFYINRRKDDKIVRGVFSVIEDDKEIIIEITLIKIDANFYKD